MYGQGLDAREQLAVAARTGVGLNRFDVDRIISKRFSSCRACFQLVRVLVYARSQQMTGSCPMRGVFLRPA
eukprot:10402638-Lingulodinium_polyedra.AAC.1